MDSPNLHLRQRLISQHLDMQKDFYGALSTQQQHLKQLATPITLHGQCFNSPQR